MADKDTRMSVVTTVITAALGITILISGPIVAEAEGFDRQFSFDSPKLLVTNLVGEIHVERADGDDFEISVSVRGDDASEDIVTFDSKDGKTARLLVKFPVKDERRYVYPEKRHDGTCTLNYPPRDDGNDPSVLDLLGLTSRKRIKVSDSGRGLEVWADLTIGVPNGASLDIVHGVGDIYAEILDASLSFDVSDGAVDVSDVRGDVTVDTGNGGVALDGITGDVIADTGNGGVDLIAISGSITADTGNGSVDLNECEGDEISVDTGNGSVHAERVVCRRLLIDTGNGGVKAFDLEADTATIDTKNNSIIAEFSRMGDGKFIVDTGSGGIELTLPRDASADITADTGSGSIVADVTGLEKKRWKKGYAEFQVGGGDARVVLDSGSGSIRIYQ